MTISAKFIARPNLRFLFDHPTHFISMGFGLGLIPMALRPEFGLDASGTLMSIGVQVATYR